MLTSRHMIPTFHKEPTIPTFNRGSTALMSHLVNTLIPMSHRDKMSRLDNLILMSHRGSTTLTFHRDKMSRRGNTIPTFRRSSTILTSRRGNIILNHKRLRLIAGGNETPSYY